MDVWLTTIKPKMILFSMMVDPCKTANMPYISVFISKIWKEVYLASIILQQQTRFEESSWIPILSKHCRQKRCKKSPYRSICLLNTNYRPQHRVMHIPVMRSDDYSHSFSWSQKTISYQVFINKKTYELIRLIVIVNKKIVNFRYYTTNLPPNI